MSILKLTRYAENPIMTGTGDVKAFDGVGAMNAGAALFNGEVHLLYRGDGTHPRTPGNTRYLSTIGHAVSLDGFHISQRSSSPVIDDVESPDLLRILGVQEPCITQIGDTYYIVYSIYSDCYERLALATTRDFRTFVKVGIMENFMAQTKGVLFPQKFSGNYLMFCRPRPHLRLCEGSDLMHWGYSSVLVRNTVLPWTKMQISACGTPIRTGKAWAVFFMGKGQDRLCRLGILWLDLANPWKILHIQSEPVLEPEAEYELDGVAPGIMYSCGNVVKDGQVIVYYGAADTCLCAATMPLEDLELK